MAVADACLPKLPQIPRPEFNHRSPARRVTFGMFLFSRRCSASMAGLMLIYGTNLPQIDELTRYRPDTTTELLDVQGG